jgi:predicted acyltransferase
MSSPQTASPETAAPAANRRLISVDALRGFDMFWILGADALVGALHKMAQGGSAAFAPVAGFFAYQLEHADWAGFRFYDLIFPLFVFLVGVSIVFSLRKAVERDGMAGAHRRVWRRFAVLFLLALLYSGGFTKEWPEIRLLGVLNRIALCYLFASLLFLHLRLRGLLVACAALLAGYWALMTFVPVPGIGAGSFAKGANLANWLDAQYLPGRKWDGTWDPEGLLSTLPAIATCLLGVFAGLWLANPAFTDREKARWLVGLGVIGVVAGALWGLQFPVIKKIWTSSYVLVAGGFSAMLLGVFHHVTEVRGWRGWATPFIWIGANAITLYLANNLLRFRDVAKRFAGGDVRNFFETHVAIGCGDMLISVVGILLAIGLAAFLYRRGIFLRV